MERILNQNKEKRGGVKSYIANIRDVNKNIKSCKKAKAYYEKKAFQSYLLMIHDVHKKFDNEIPCFSGLKANKINDKVVRISLLLKKVEECSIEESNKLLDNIKKEKVAIHEEIEEIRWREIDNQKANIEMMENRLKGLKRKKRKMLKNFRKQVMSLFKIAK